MLSPYDWQESILQRAQYIENRLKGGSPIVGLSIDSGVLLYTYRRHVRKVYEVYDRLMFSAIGQQADVESLRITAIDFAHQEGYQRAEEDVTIGRLVGFALSSPLKKAFGDISVAPFVVHALFAELNTKVEDDMFLSLNYDGDFSASRRFAVAAGSQEMEQKMSAHIEKSYKPSMSLDVAAALADEAWKIGADRDGNGEPDPELLREARPEIGLLERGVTRERKFRLL